MVYFPLFVKHERSIMKPFLFFSLLLLIFAWHNVYAQPDIFSKVVITSKRATCKKDGESKHSFIFRYLDNVVVTLADKSIIKADALEVILTTAHAKKSCGHKNNADTKQKTGNLFKKIFFTGNVHVTSGQRALIADKATINVGNKTCLLEDNVSIEQKKTNPSDIPLTTRSARATINLATMETILEGNDQEPVTTSLVFDEQQTKKANHPHPPSTKAHSYE